MGQISHISQAAVEEVDILVVVEEMAPGLVEVEVGVDLITPD
jgi:hypothetical protein